MDQLSTMTGVSPRDIRDMHDVGVSYGAMAGELGVQIHSEKMVGAVSGSMNRSQTMGSSSAVANVGMNSNHYSQQGLTGVGVNSQMGYRSNEIMGATARNNESGWSEGHGIGMQTSSGQGGIGGMMAGASGLGNGMGNADVSGHGSGGMGGGMGASSNEGNGSVGMGSPSGGGMGSASSHFSTFSPKILEI